MANIELCNITKKFGKITALDDFSLEIKDKEFFVLFGPAGAGKTTMLNTIAGICFPDDGLVKMDGKVVNLIEPAKRDVSMVFENYALYPHMTVYDNIASPMRSPLHKKDEEYIKKEVKRVAELMNIGHLMERLPSQLSNGQRQRVALGRCLVRNPKVFLMDEPLAHLDAKLRNFMRSQLKEMQAHIHSTTIYVTHDYLEALGLGDRIGIINKGKIVQIGTGDEVYYTPKNEFVAKLIGEPEINITNAELVQEDGKYKVSIFKGLKRLDIDNELAAMLTKTGSKEFDMGVRGNDIKYSLENTGDDCIEGTVYNTEPIGNKSILVVDIKGDLVKLIAPNDLNLPIDSKIFIKVNTRNSLFFDISTKDFIGRYNMSEYSKEVK